MPALGRIEIIIERETERWRSGFRGVARGREALSKKTKNHWLVPMHTSFRMPVSSSKLPIVVIAFNNCNGYRGDEVNGYSNDPPPTRARTRMIIQKNLVHAKKGSP